MTASQPARMDLPGQVVLVLRGGGALGAFQLGVFQAMDEAGIRPDWVVGTSIGAINAALIAGNPPAQRYEKLSAFWRRVTERTRFDTGPLLPGWNRTLAELMIIGGGIAGFFQPNPASWLGPMVRLGVDRASYYRIAPLRDCIADRSRAAERGPPAPDRQRGQCVLGHDALFRFPRYATGARAHHELRRAAARVPGDQDRRRAVLGRRRVFEHAGRGRARRQPRRSSIIFGPDVEPGRPRLEHLAGVGAAEGHPVREPHRQPHRAPAANSPVAPRDPRAGPARAGSRTRVAGRAPARRVGMRNHDASDRSRRRDSPTTISSRTSISRRPASRPAGRPATRPHNGPSRRVRGRHRRTRRKG